MTDVCPKCGLEKDLCVCETIAKEEQNIVVKRGERRWGKAVTVIEGLGEEIDVEDLASDLKSRLACGGTVKEGKIELQGDHRRDIMDVLKELGFEEESITVKN